MAAAISNKLRPGTWSHFFTICATRLLTFVTLLVFEHPQATSYHCSLTPKVQLQTRLISSKEQPILMRHVSAVLTISCHCWLASYTNQHGMRSASCTRQQNCKLAKLQISKILNWLPVSMSNAHLSANSAINKLHVCLAGKPEGSDSVSDVCS